MSVYARHKHLKLDQRKINQAKKYFGVKTETEAIERALDFLVAEETINKTLRRTGGRGRLKKVYD